MLFSFYDLVELFKNAFVEPLEFILFWALILCLVPRLNRWAALPLLIISLILAIKDFLEPSGWNFVGTLIFLLLVLVAPIIGTFVLLIPRMMKFLAKNYADLNNLQKSQRESGIEIQYERKQEFLFNFKVGVLALVFFFEFLYPLFFFLFISFAVMVGKLTGQT